MQMDLNYLFHRQQVERTRAEAAGSEEARVAHEQLARCYEAQINQATDGEFEFPAESHIESNRSKNGR
jgi:hypothetical protein